MNGRDDFRCAAASHLRHDQLAGTAARADGWVLVEHLGPWPFGGFAELPLPVEVVAAVRDSARAAGMRILLIRRHGRREAGRPRRWGVLRYDAGGAHRQEWGSWSEPADLLHIVDAIGRRGDVGLPPVYLVCTHGVHDACCAIRGRPVVRALALARPDNTWECSHVGGDRYAANVVVVPDGVYFGDVTADEAVGQVALLEAGLVSAGHLRGYCELAPPVQFAVAEVLRRFGPAGRHAIQLDGAHRVDGRWRISLTADPPLPARVDVELQVVALPPTRLTCFAPAPTRPVAFRTVGFHALPARE